MLDVHKKIALGTVQFGLDYGINNPVGKVDLTEIEQILTYALKSGIDTLDTASLYGDSEKRLGQFSLPKFKIISKLPDCKVNEVKSHFMTSLEHLKQERIYGYIIHHFDTYRKQPELFSAIKELKEDGLIEKIGFSLYHPYELEYLIENEVEFQLVQFPLNIFDQRFIPYLDFLKQKGVEIHIRSAFLQGLFFMNTEDLPNHFQSVKSKLIRLNELCTSEGIDKSLLCLGFLVENQNIDKVVIGVDNVTQLQSNVKHLSFLGKIQGIKDELYEMKEKDEQIILPMNWQI